MTKKLLFIVFGAGVCLSLLSAALAQAQTFTWKNLSSMYGVNGLAVVQGKVWAATSGGVFSYSPLTGAFNEFTTTDSLSNIQATSIIVETGDRILVGEGNGAIDELDASSGKVLRSQLDIANSSHVPKQVTKLSISGDTLFACTPFGVVVISLSKFNVLSNYLNYVPSQAFVPANGTAAFNGNVYVASQHGLSFAPQSSVNLSAPDLWKMSDDSDLTSGVNALAVFDGMLFAGTSQGLYYSSDGTTFQQRPELGNASVRSLSVSGNSLLVNSHTGLFKIDANNSLTMVYNGGISLNDAATYSDTLTVAASSQGLLNIGSSIQVILPPGPATNIIGNLSVDNSGNLWCSTQGDTTDIGVAFIRFDGTSWKNFSKASYPQLPSNSTYFKISAVCGNRVVVGTWGNGMVLLQDSSIESIFNYNNSSLVSTPGNTPGYVVVGDAVCDPSGNIWMTNFGAYNGNILAEYTPATNKWQSFFGGNSPAPGYAPIAIDAYGGIWAGDEYGLGTSFYGLFYYNPATKQSESFSTEYDSFLSNQVNALLVNSENQLWIGTSGGLGVYYDPSNPYMFLINSMLDLNITGIDYDALDNKWVSTLNGVSELSPDGDSLLAQFNITNSPLPSNSVNSVACDRIHGIVYFATPYGITQLKIGVVQPLDNFSKLKIYPNPAKLPLSNNEQIQIVGLVTSSSIKIFSISGRLVKEFQAQGGNKAYWDGKDDGGNLVPTGIYIVLAYSSDGSQSVVGKIAIIRE